MTSKADLLFEKAIELDEEARIAFVNDACRSDPENCAELKARLEEYAGAEKFFGRLSDAVFSSQTSNGDENDSASSAGYSDLQEGDSIRQYRIVSTIGRGGMGTIYRAHDTRLDRDVALKFLPHHVYAHAAAQEQLLSEARAAAALDHPNVCSVYEIGETTDNSLYIAMPCYDGETLKARLKAGRLAIDESLRIAIQITRGLAAAHRRGIVHRDVKPANVMLGADGTVRLLDFGVATMVHASRTEGELNAGTAAYMSPEQAQGQSVDERSDLWSLGVVLYEMIAGSRPFTGGSTHRILHAVLHESPRPVSTVRQEVPPALSQIINRLLKKDASQRYATATELLKDLEREQSRIQSRRPFLARIAVIASIIVALTAAALWIARANDSNFREDRTRATPSVAAHELYVRGSDPVLLRSDSGVRLAFTYLAEAVALDSNYAAAYAGIARLHLRIGFGGNDSTMSRRARLVLAEQAASRSVRLDSLLGDAHLALGMVRRNNYQMQSAEAEHKRAVALEPASSLFHDKLSVLYSLMGRHEDALIEARRAVMLDSLSPGARAEVANALMTGDHCDEALIELHKLRTLSPPLLRAGGMTSLCYAEKQMWPEAIDAARRIVPNGGPRAAAILGYVLARSGRDAEAREVLHSLMERAARTRENAFDVALVYAGLDDMDEAFAWLDRSIDDRSFAFEWLSPIERKFRKDARFNAVARRVGLPSSE